METTGLVSILMNCLNGEKYVDEAIDTVLQQTYQHWELIFWDNASTDRTGELVQKYRDPRIRYFRAQTTVPLYAARNLALEKTRGEFVAFLDIDDKWMPTKLEKQLPLFRNPKVGLVYSDTYFFNETGIIYQYYKHKDYYTGRCFERLLDSYFLSLETVVIRKKCLENQSYFFDERFNMCGDLDLFCRIGHDWELDMVNEVLGMWRVDRKSLSWTQTNKFFDETEMMLERFRNLYPDFENKYQREIATIKRNLEVGKAKVFLREGNNQQARKLMAKFLWGPNLKPKILFVLACLPQVMTKPWASKRF